MRATKTLIRGASAVAGLSVGLAMGCLNVRPDPNHCSNLDGDRTCEARYPGERTFCTWGTCGPTPGEDGCVAERPADDACYSPCGAGAQLDDDATCLVDPSSSSGEETSTGEETTSGTDTGSGSSGSTTGPMPCMGNEDCPDAAMPLCEPGTGECVTCDAFGAEGDAACAELDPMAPLCVGQTCVTCTPENPVVCDDQLLLCDGSTNSCVPCTEHDQCGSGACELAAGKCFPEDFVAHVDGDGPADYMTITAAVAAVDGTHGVIVVHELDMAASYQATVTVDGGKTIALLAAPGEAPVILGTGGNPGLQVTGAGTTLYMDGLQVSQSPAQGLVVDGAFAWVDRSRIVQNTGGGVLAQNGAELTLRNCFVGDGTNGKHALMVDGTTSMPSAEVSYSTLGVGVDNFNDVFPVFCDGAVDVTIRNSLLVSFDNPVELSCTMAVVTNTASEALIPGTSNVALGDIGVDWFVAIDTGNFHLDNPPAMLSTTAQWNTGDPLTDIDGDPRPNRDGAMDYAGADVP